jgi:hypothetical protein
MTKTEEQILEDFLREAEKEEYERFELAPQATSEYLIALAKNEAVMKNTPIEPSICQPAPVEHSASPADAPLVFAFHRPHEVGKVCGYPCDQCGEGEMELGHRRAKDLRYYYFVSVD